MSPRCAVLSMPVQHPAHLEGPAAISLYLSTRFDQVTKSLLCAISRTNQSFVISLSMLRLHPALHSTFNVCWILILALNGIVIILIWTRS